MSVLSCAGSAATAFTSSSVGGRPTRTFFTFATYDAGGAATNGCAPASVVGPPPSAAAAPPAPPFAPGALPADEQAPASAPSAQSRNNKALGIERGRRATTPLDAKSGRASGHFGCC